MEYCEVSIISNAPYAYDILTAALADLGYESFQEDAGVLKAYINANEFDGNELAALHSEYEMSLPFTFTVSHIPHQNWNEVWESNFQPISVGNRLHVRADFHTPDPAFPLEIVINPKMSFGTGHHATTASVMSLMLDMEWKGKKVLDFGTGTGILAILACKLGASEVYAIDNDPQCIDNSIENFALNGCQNIRLKLGDIYAFETELYNCIIANITRNTILEFLSAIAVRISSGGYFLASGFYEQDLPIIADQAKLHRLHLHKTISRDLWCAASFVKD